MLHKCANPACLAPFRELSRGKLFLVETGPLAVSELRRANGKPQTSRRIEYYWLCDPCSFALTLSYEKERGVVTVPRPDLAKKRPVAPAHSKDVLHNPSSLTEQSA